ncbi:hypothetical protein SAMN05421868_13049 [Paenibacillus naphthalenovorans]|nr:hypothetical protein SAMN05421868_13049 [Paenibacillus naphthalenovorans]
MSIGGRIKQIRLENNLNQKTFSEEFFNLI